MSGPIPHNPDRVRAARNALLGLHANLGEGRGPDEQLELLMGLLSGVAGLLSTQLGAPTARAVLVGVAAQLVPLDAAARLAEAPAAGVPVQ